MKIVTVLILSFAGGFFGAYLIKRYGSLLGLVDVPNIRSSHEAPTPRGGGVGITLIVTLMVTLFLPLYFILVVIALCLAAFALVDDIRSLPVKWRLVVEILAASAVIVLYQKDLFINEIHNHIGLQILLACLLLLYMVAGLNFFNFMDGINGIAGFAAIISFLFIGFFNLHFKGSEDLYLLTLSVCAATAGFLMLNFPKARVFMGDIGSIFLGFLFVVMVIISARNIKDFVFLVLFQSVFYIDCVFTIVLRRIKGENIFSAHKFHLYQELVHRKGWSHTKVALIYSSIQLLICILAWLVYPLSPVFLILFWLLLMIIYIGIRMRYFALFNTPEV